MPLKQLRQSETMAHLIDALERGEDIGHYGRLVFAMTARFFADEKEIVAYLARNPGIDEVEARGLYQEVRGHGYNPPRRQQLLEWHRQQEFPLCPNPEDPDACNLYEELRFPEEVYEHIRDYYRQKGRAARW